MRMSSIAPDALDDQDVYLILDDFGGHIGRSWREADENLTDREQVIAHLIDGQYKDPVRVIAFNTAQGWARDVSRELADIISQECYEAGFDFPPSLTGFIEQHGSGGPSQLALPLRASQSRS